MFLTKLFGNLFSQDKRDINLIPHNEGTKLTSKTISFALLLISITGALTLGSFIFKQLKSREIQILQGQISQLETGEWKKVKPTAELLNLAKIQIASWQKFSVEYPPLDQKIIYFNETIPKTVKLFDLTIDNLGKISASCKAEKPEDINLWLKEMENKKSFENIQIAGITKNADNYTFSITLDSK